MAKRKIEIYALTEPSSGEVRYIGKANNAQKRFKGHLSETWRTTPVYCRIKSLRAKGLEALNRICSEPGMPSRKSFYDWVAEDETVLRRYKLAMVMRADVYAEQTIEIVSVGTRKGNPARAMPSTRTSNASTKWRPR